MGDVRSKAAERREFHLPRLVLELGDVLEVDDREAVPGDAGLYDVTPDWHPLLGPVGGHEGLHLATGGSGHCFKLGPAIGELVAGAILGKPVGFASVASFSLSRFAEDRQDTFDAYVLVFFATDARDFPGGFLNFTRCANAEPERKATSPAIVSRAERMMRDAGYEADDSGRPQKTRRWFLAD